VHTSTTQLTPSRAERALLRREWNAQLRTRTTTSRTFSVSAAQRATVCVHNPVKDDEGNEMMLEITPRAAKVRHSLPHFPIPPPSTRTPTDVQQRLSQIAAKDQNPNLALRISVESGGCHGFQYLMKLITIPADETRTAELAEDDTVFQFSGEDGGSARVVLDEPSLDLLKGSKVDFTQELIGSQFKIVDNPYATSSCGCGTSFDIKM
jgi:iron-sulfur cluster assembly 2